MPSKNSTSKLSAFKKPGSFRSRKRFWNKKLLIFVALFAIVAGIFIYRSFALSNDIVIKGKVTINGVGIKDVLIDGCQFDVPGYGVAAVTDANGNFSYLIHAQANQGYCVRVYWSDYLPSSNVAVAHNKKIMGDVNWPPKTSNRTAYANAGRYEYQIAGVNCHNAGSNYGCNPNGAEQSWDLSSDTNFVFTFTSNNPVPPPTTTPTLGSCALPASTTLTVDPHKYTGSPPSGTTVDARGLTISSLYGWLATPGSNHICWLGGELKNTISDSDTGSPTDAWTNYWHQGGGFDLKNVSSWTVDSATIHHTGDGFNVSSGGNNFELRNSHLYDIRDDCVQNDYYLSGSIHDNYFESCYSGFSSKASKGSAPDGTGHTMTINNNIIYMAPTWSVYKGDSPGTGHLIKWAKPDAGLGTPEHLVFKNNVVRIDKCPFQTGSSCSTTYFPTDAEYSNNSLYWGGSGPIPAELVNLFSSKYGSRLISKTQWDASVAFWKGAHQGVK
ncbi:MAG: right-handed parallel beta-helix repeat-containing protein [Candidatus Saccharimonadales bacterium]